METKSQTIWLSNLLVMRSSFPYLSKWGPDHRELGGQGEEFALFLRSNARPPEGGRQVGR